LKRPQIIAPEPSRAISVSRSTHVDTLTACIQTDRRRPQRPVPADLRGFFTIRTAAVTLLFRRRGGSDVESAPGNEEAVLRVGIMAQKTVQLIIGQILTDEEFRSDFLERPLEILRSLRERGVELTNVEIDALAQTDRRFWLIGAEWIDARLQRCRLVGGQRT
jgi:hypothetical protein